MVWNTGLCLARWGQPPPPGCAPSWIPVKINPVLAKPRTQVHVCLILGTPKMDAVLQVGFHRRRVEGQNELPCPAGHTSLYIGQDTTGLQSHICWLESNFSSTCTPQVLFCGAALNPFIPQPVLILGISLAQGQGLAFHLVELREFYMGIQPVKIPLHGIPSL